MRIALDTSILVAAHVSRAGVCAELLEDVLAAHVLIVSDYVLREFEEKLVGKLRFDPRLGARAVDFVRSAAETVVPVEPPRDACRDPKDLPVLGTAVAGRADLLVTVDLDLLVLAQVDRVAIVRPRDYFARVRGAPRT